MDSALELKRMLEEGSSVSEPLVYLENSAIVEKYQQLPELTDLGKIFALIGLAEIPHSAELAITQELFAFIDEEIATGEGFSYTRKPADIVPCYNAMLLEAYCRLGLGNSAAAQSALTWIKKYQLFQRNQVSAWSGSGICKHGGCLKKTPCYIGIGKTMRALIAYRDLVDSEDQAVLALLEKGAAYMADHQFYKRLSRDRPILAHITESMFPQSYALSLTDLVYIAERMNMQNTAAAAELRALLQEKQTGTKGWKNEYIYKYKGYVAFNDRRKDSPWLTDLYQCFMGEA